MQKAYRLHPFASLLLNPLYKLCYPFSKLRKPNVKISVLFVFFLSSSHNSKSIVCMRILHVPNDCSTTGHLPFLVLGGVQGTTGELQPRNCLQKCIVFSFEHFCGFFLHIQGVAHNQATPRLLNACVRGYDEFARDKLCVSKSWTVILSIYLLYLKIVQFSKECYCLYIVAV